MDQTPRSPTHRQVLEKQKTKAMAKLETVLHGAQLEDLMLDYIGTSSFSDMYVLKELLGCGSFGVVLRVVEKATGQEHAMKVKYKCKSNR